MYDFSYLLFKAFRSAADSPFLSSQDYDQCCEVRMGIEEQKEEREVLDSIFPDEITGKHHYENLQEIWRPI